MAHTEIARLSKLMTRKAIDRRFSESSVARERFASYPANVRDKLNQLRGLIYAAADEVGESSLQETLKWGELSFVCRQGSTIRIDWKASSPDHVCAFFNCKSRLVETYREVYGDCLHLESNRALKLPLYEPLPEDILVHCFSMALRYHKLKKLPLLGAV